MFRLVGGGFAGRDLRSRIRMGLSPKHAVPSADTIDLLSLSAPAGSECARTIEHLAFPGIAIANNVLIGRAALAKESDDKSTGSKRGCAKPGLCNPTAPASAAFCRWRSRGGLNSSPADDRRHRLLIVRMRRPP